MFLEDELNAAFENGADNATIIKILQSRLPDLVQVGNIAFINAIRQVNFIWKQFCLKHPNYNPDGFKRIILYSCKDLDEKTKTFFEDLLK